MLTKFVFCSKDRNTEATKEEYKKKKSILKYKGKC